MRIDTRNVGNVLVVKPLERRIDARAAGEFKKKLGQAIEEGNRRVVLEMAEVDFIDSSGLGAIVSALKQMGRQGEIVIANVRETVMSMLKLTRMDKVFQVFDGVGEAIETLESQDFALSED